MTTTPVLTRAGTSRRRGPSSGRRDIESRTSGQLALAARDGDEQAAAELYRRTVRRAQAAARCFCRDADTDDAVAEGLSRALIRLAQLHDPEAVEAWMIRCVVRAALDLTRRGQRQRPWGTVEVLSAAGPPGESAAEQALSTLERSAMASVLGQLAAEPRLILQLRYEAGLSVERIAVALGRPAGTVRRQCLEARRVAAQCFLCRQLRPAQGSCAPITELLCQALLYGRCSPVAARRVQEHLRHCQGCRDRRQELTEVLAELGVRVAPDPAPAA